jgi:hypothetical protein
VELGRRHLAALEQAGRFLGREPERVDHVRLLSGSGTADLLPAFSLLRKGARVGDEAAPKLRR